MAGRVPARDQHGGAGGRGQCYGGRGQCYGRKRPVIWWEGPVIWWEDQCYGCACDVCVGV